VAEANLSIASGAIGYQISQAKAQDTNLLGGLETKVKFMKYFSLTSLVKSMQTINTQPFNENNVLKLVPVRVEVEAERCLVLRLRPVTGNLQTAIQLQTKSRMG
jgi:hypothetical protein